MRDHDRSKSLQGRRILIVEDEWFIVVELVQFLTDNGAVVIGPVGSVEDGLELATLSADLDGAILNIALQDRYSYPIADALRDRGVPFAFATGIDAWAIPSPYASVPRISKPFETAAVVQALFAENAAAS